MTTMQEEQIRLLREQGVGYRNIGNIVHLSRDVVRNYCRTHNLNGYHDAVKKNMLRMIADRNVCTYCGAPIKQKKTGRPKKFCSDKCRLRWWQQNRDQMKKNPDAMYEFHCNYCGKPFTAYGNKKRLYCCHDCYVRDRFWSVSDDFVEENKEDMYLPFC